VTAADRETRPRKKKKRKSAADKAGRPAFARAYPASGELDRLLLAFAAGNYAEVRREAPKLAAATNDAAVRAAAQDLRRRIDPDPTSIYLLAIGVLLLGVVYVWYLMHPR
jgi:hypothetical protein